MPIIKLETRIKSTIGICFDLSRSIDLHKISIANTNEEAVDGIMSGLIKDDEFVTWQATHFGIKQKLSSKITAFDKPNYFRDEQIKGIFKSIKHDHYFFEEGQFVIMKDVFSFESPCGILGKLFNKIILTSYLEKLLTDRNNVIKEFAETDKWKSVLYFL